MKVSEIRDITKKLDKSVIVELLVKTYRHVPKEKKEELDQMILSGNPKVTTKKSEEIKTAEDFNDIKAPIEFFIENAYEGNYLKPNRIINKSRRSKWRFEAKKAYKCLTDISENDINYTDAGKLLQSLYDVLSYGCGCWIFASDDTFRAMGVLQTDFFRVVCEKRLRTGVNKDTIGALISSIMKGFTDRETLNIELYAVLASVLKTSDAKYLAIEAASEKIKSIKKDIALEEERQKGKRFKSYGIKWYKETENINDLCEFVEILSLYLGDKEEGSDFFWKNQTEDDKEIALFRLLNIIALFSGDFPEWCRVYEDAVERFKISPRESIREIYQNKSFRKD